jgi:hypothetical protein
LGVPLWCQDEAGPYQAIPQPGASWQPEGEPARQPHEYLRGGTAKLLTLFRPATGAVRAKPVERAPNAVLHPWLIEQLGEILAELPPSPAGSAVADPAAGLEWSEWGDPALITAGPEGLPPIRVVLVWDNLAGHKSAGLVSWCLAHGILPLYTPIGGSWLNMAESVQRILVRRALAGQHPESAAEVMDWLGATVRGWNEAPTAFVWGGKRRERRRRARERRHAAGGSGAYTRRPLPRHRRSRLDRVLNGHSHDN